MSTGGVMPKAFLRWWYPWAFWEQCLLLYPVYALIIEDRGIDSVGIASLFMVWSMAAFLSEVPSGALADRFPRHRVLAAGAMLRAVAFSLWLVAPTYLGFLAGFVLWGVAGALHSGTREALLHEHLERAGVATRFQQCWGRTSALHNAGGAVALATGGLVAHWNMTAPLILSIVISIASAFVAIRCFAVAGISNRHVVAPHGVMLQLRAGIKEALTRRAVLVAVCAVALGPVVINAYEEFIPLFLRERDATVAQVGLLFAIIYAGHVAGATLSDRLDPVDSRTGYRGAVGWMAVAGLALVAAAGIPGLWTVAALLTAFFAWGVFSVGLQARLQRAIRGDARATVTSLAAVGELGSAQVVLLAIGFSAAAAGWTGATLWAGGMLVAVTIALGTGFRIVARRTASA